MFKYLLAVVFISGMSIMAVEMSASRLLAPYFGTSLFVWTNIIGIIMIALALGYYIGGRISDAYPKENLFYSIILISGLFIALIPFIAKPIMTRSIEAINNQSISLFYTSLIATIALFALPLILLGMVSPFAIKLCSKEFKKVGHTSGSIYALSTAGSIIGTFIPALLTIPFIGTKRTILLFAFILVFSSAIGLKKKKFILISFLVLVLFLFIGTIKATPGLVYESESPYNYIQVIERDNRFYLRLNEGHSTHSIYDPDSVLVNGVWDYFSILPLLNKQAKEVLIIGLACGTISKQYSYFFPNISIDGIEIDNAIIKAGERFFDMKEPNLNIYTMDGRIFLQASNKKYDIIIVDAYKQPYIPFHLTTKEFFLNVKAHLNKNGILAINVGSTSMDSNVLQMITTTIKSVYKNVYIIEIPNYLNYIVIGSDYQYDLENIDSDNILLNGLVKKLIYEKVSFNNTLLVLTDDKAPVEIFTDKMILDYARE